jgi:hypothetical protein
MTSITTDTNINISQDSEGNWFYQIGEGSIEPMSESSFPLTIISTYSSVTIPIYVFFTTDITITRPDQFFIVGSDGIDFFGLRNKLMIDNVTNYPGLIKNGTSGDNGKSRVYAEYIRIYAVNGSTLAAGNGWIGQAYFGKGSTYNYFTDCSADGPIPANSGGIVGNYAGYSLGAIGTDSGGICGQTASTTGTIIIANCYSSGEIGDYAGGILAANSDGLLILIQYCYSTGVIGASAGGIVGANAGNFITVSNSYSSGLIAAFAGGIYGADISLMSRAMYCYTSGIGANATSGGIYANNPNDIAIGTSNYSECNNGNTGTWTPSHISGVLDGIPASGSLYGETWCRPTLDSPYELTYFGLSPYTTDMSTSYFQTIAQGGTSVPSVLPAGYTYSILAVYDDSTDTQIPFASKFSINSSTGVITVSNTCPIGDYIVIVRDSINPYDITEFNITVNLICYGPGTRVLIGEPQIEMTKLQKRNGAMARPPPMNERYVDISNLRPGMLVKTVHDGYVPIMAVGVKTIRTGDTPLTTLFRVPCCGPDDSKSELLVTGGHSILVNNDVIKQIPRETCRLFKYQRTKIDNCQRVLAMNWPGATCVPAGLVTDIYHLVLDGRRRDANYGIYVNGGWLSETTTTKYFKRFGFKNTPYATTFVPNEPPLRGFLFSVQAGNQVRTARHPLAMQIPNKFQTENPESQTM